MFLARAAIVCVVAMLCSGCAIWDKEVNNRGGYVDHLADNHFFKADSKKMRTLRAFAIQVSLARIASVSPKNDSDRRLLAMRIGATTARARHVIDCAFVRDTVTGEPCFYFDSAMVDYVSALYDLALLALPLEEGRRLMESVVGAVTNPLDAVRVLTSLVELGREAFKYGRVVGAIYRDALELEVQVWINSPNAPQGRIPPQDQVTAEHVAGLARIYDKGNDDIVAWKRAIAELRAKGLEPVPQGRFIDELGGLMRYICRLITQDPEGVTECMLGLPETIQTTPVARPLLAKPKTVARSMLPPTVATMR